MSEFMKVYTPVNEGVGTAVAKIVAGSTSLVFLARLFTSIISWKQAILYSIAAGTVGAIAKGMSEAKVIEFMGDPKIHKYIEHAATEMFKKLKKDYPNLQEFTSDVSDTFESQLHAAKSRMGVNKSIQNMIFINKELGAIEYKHTIVVLADTTHIEDVCVIFREKRLGQYIAVPLPPPSESELKAYYTDK